MIHGNQRRKVVKSGTVVILGIVFVLSVTNESEEKVSVDAFVVMQRDEVQVVKPEHRRDQHDRDHADQPNVIRNVGAESGRRWSSSALGLDSGFIRFLA